MRSSYVAGFQLPVLPGLAWRTFATRGYERLTGRRIGDNAVRGLALYRANWFRQ
ncbi:alpha/beta hydrolase, partial [Arthrobacter deserti]|nr:alpha/beta hydrolase [Arthrobacter deserti]